MLAKGSAVGDASISGDTQGTAPAEEHGGEVANVTVVVVGERKRPDGGVYQERTGWQRYLFGWLVGELLAVYVSLLCLCAVDNDGRGACAMIERDS